MTNEEILAKFKEEGQTASFHYADDTGQEWHLGSLHSDRCKKLWDEHPELHDEMRVIKKRFLMNIGD